VPVCRIWVDCGGLLVAPGLVDLQINGAFGVDFSAPDLDAAGVRLVRRGLLSHGVTAVCPTMVSSSPRRYARNLPLLSPSASSAASDGCSVLGAHIEGPFFALERKGAHQAEHVTSPAAAAARAAPGAAALGSGPYLAEAALREAYGAGAEGWEAMLLRSARVVTLAPELPGSCAVAQWLSSRGVLVSMGHTSASVEDGEAGIASGATMLTHLFNAMAGFHHRDPGLVGLLGRQCSDSMPRAASPGRPGLVPLQAGHSGTDDECVSSLVSSVPAPLSGLPASERPTARPWYSVIVDGIHAHPYSVTMARTAHPDGLVLVTDGMAALGLPRGRHALGDLVVHVDLCPPGAISDAGASAGSTACSVAPRRRAPSPAASDGEEDDATGDASRMSDAVGLAAAGDDGAGDEEPGVGEPAGCRVTASRGDFRRPALDGPDGFCAAESARGGRLRAVLAGTSTLAGAVLPLDACVRNLFRFTRCSRAEAVAAASYRPSLALGDTARRGLLLPGRRADLAILHPASLRPVQTWVAGQLAWSRHRGITA